MKKLEIGLLAAFMMLGVESCIKGASPEQHDDIWLIVGSYAQSDSAGIKSFLFNQDTGDAVLKGELSGISNPSYLIPSNDGNLLFAVGEDEGPTSTINSIAFDKNDGNMSIISSKPTNGGAPCYVSISPDRQWVVTANYLGGNISIVRSIYSRWQVLARK